MNNNPANQIKDVMWRFLMDKEQKSNVPARTLPRRLNSPNFTIEETFERKIDVSKRRGKEAGK